MSVVPVLAASVLEPIYDVMGAVLAFFYSVVPSYGFAIALLTVSVRLLLFPLFAKQVKSQQAMQRIQPELKRLQAKYKNDRQKLNEEMMKFYKENSVNPLAGCLPLILQAPLFIVLYRLILGLTHKPQPKHLPHDSKLFASLLESGGKMVSWGIDLAKSASTVGGFGKAWPYYILVAITVATGFYQQRQMTARQPKDSINPQMQMVAKIFPAMIGLISLSVPAGVVVYFIVSNLWQIGQQAITFRTLPAAPAAGGKADKSGPEPGKGGPEPTRGKGKGGIGGGAGTAGAGGRRGQSRGERGNNGSSSGSGDRAKKQTGNAGKTGKTQGQGQGQGQGQNKGKRPPPSPRPKGLPSSGKPGQKGTSAKNSRRKDT